LAAKGRANFVKSVNQPNLELERYREAPKSAQGTIQIKLFKTSQSIPI
jgi:hypothetical protein